MAKVTLDKMLRLYRRRIGEDKETWLNRIGIQDEDIKNTFIESNYSINKLPEEQIDRLPNWSPVKVMRKYFVQEGKILREADINEQVFLDLLEKQGWKHKTYEDLEKYMMPSEYASAEDYSAATGLDISVARDIWIKYKDKPILPPELNIELLKKQTANKKGTLGWAYVNGVESLRREGVNPEGRFLSSDTENLVENIVESIVKKKKPIEIKVKKGEKVPRKMFKKGAKEFLAREESKMGEVLPPFGSEELGKYIGGVGATALPGTPSDPVLLFENTIKSFEDRGIKIEGEKKYGLAQAIVEEINKEGKDKQYDAVIIPIGKPIIKKDKDGTITSIEFDDYDVAIINRDLSLTAMANYRMGKLSEEVSFKKKDADITALGGAHMLLSREQANIINEELPPSGREKDLLEFGSPATRAMYKDMLASVGRGLSYIGHGLGAPLRVITGAIAGGVIEAKHGGGFLSISEKAITNAWKNLWSDREKAQYFTTLLTDPGFLGTVGLLSDVDSKKYNDLVEKLLSAQNATERRRAQIELDDFMNKRVMSPDMIGLGLIYDIALDPFTWSDLGLSKLVGLSAQKLDKIAGKLAERALKRLDVSYTPSMYEKTKERVARLLDVALKRVKHKGVVKTAEDVVRSSEEMKFDKLNVENRVARTIREETELSQNTAEAIIASLSDGLKEIGPTSTESQLQGVINRAVLPIDVQKEKLRQQFVELSDRAEELQKILKRQTEIISDTNSRMRGMKAREGIETAEDVVDMAHQKREWLEKKKQTAKNKITKTKDELHEITKQRNEISREIARLDEYRNRTLGILTEGMSPLRKKLGSRAAIEFPGATAETIEPGIAASVKGFFDTRIAGPVKKYLEFDPEAQKRVIEAIRQGLYEIKGQVVEQGKKIERPEAYKPVLDNHEELEALREITSDPEWNRLSPSQKETVLDAWANELEKGNDVPFVDTEPLPISKAERKTARAEVEESIRENIAAKRTAQRLNEMKGESKGLTRREESRDVLYGGIEGGVLEPNLATEAGRQTIGADIIAKKIWEVGQRKGVSGKAIQNIVKDTVEEWFKITDPIRRRGIWKILDSVKIFDKEIGKFASWFKEGHRAKVFMKGLKSIEDDVAAMSTYEDMNSLIDALSSIAPDREKIIVEALVVGDARAIGALTEGEARLVDELREAASIAGLTRQQLSSFADKLTPIELLGLIVAKRAKAEIKRIFEEELATGKFAMRLTGKPLTGEEQAEILHRFFTPVRQKQLRNEYLASVLGQIEDMNIVETVINDPAVKTALFSSDPEEVRRLARNTVSYLRREPNSKRLLVENYGGANLIAIIDNMTPQEREALEIFFNELEAWADYVAERIRITRETGTIPNVRRMKKLRVDPQVLERETSMGYVNLIVANGMGRMRMSMDSDILHFARQAYPYIFGLGEGPRGPALRIYRKVEKWWKTLVTALNPKFHGQNFRDNMFLYFVGSPARPSNISMAPTDFISALAALLPKKARELLNVEMGTSKLTPKELRALAERYGVIDSTFYIHEFASSGGKANVVKVLNEMKKGGADPELVDRLIENINSSTSKWDRVSGGAGKVVYGIGSLNEMMGRLMLFKRLLDEGWIPEQAGEKVRRLFFDYDRLSRINKTGKKIMPFFTWAYKNLGLQPQLLFEAPGRIGNILKVAGAIGLYTRSQTGDSEWNKKVPSWLKGSYVLALPSEEIKLPDRKKIKIPRAYRIELPTTVLNGVADFLSAVNEGKGKEIAKAADELQRGISPLLGGLVILTGGGVYDAFQDKVITAKDKRYMRLGSNPLVDPESVVSLINKDGTIKESVPSSLIERTKDKKGYLVSEGLLYITSMAGGLWKIADVSSRLRGEIDLSYMPELQRALKKAEKEFTIAGDIFGIKGYFLDDLRARARIIYENRDLLEAYEESLREKLSRTSGVERKIGKGKTRQ